MIVAVRAGRGASSRTTEHVENIPVTYRRACTERAGVPLAYATAAICNVPYGNVPFNVGILCGSRWATNTPPAGRSWARAAQAARPDGGGRDPKGPLAAPAWLARVDKATPLEAVDLRAVDTPAHHLGVAATLRMRRGALPLSARTQPRVELEALAR